MWKYNDELYHAGVLGMKWGFRKRIGSINKTAQKRKPSEDHIRVQQLRKKKISQLSNKELQEYNNRKNLERSFKSFDAGVIKKGATALATTAAVMGSVVAIKNNAPQVMEVGKSILSKMRNVRIPR